MESRRRHLCWLQFVEVALSICCVPFFWICKGIISEDCICYGLHAWTLILATSLREIPPAALCAPLRLRWSIGWGGYLLSPGKRFSIRLHCPYEPYIAGSNGAFIFGDFLWVPCSVRMSREFVSDTASDTLDYRITPGLLWLDLRGARWKSCRYRTFLFAAFFYPGPPLLISFLCCEIISVCPYDSGYCLTRISSKHLNHTRIAWCWY